MSQLLILIIKLWHSSVANYDYDDNRYVHHNKSWENGGGRQAGAEAFSLLHALNGIKIMFYHLWLVARITIIQRWSKWMEHN